MSLPWPSLWRCAILAGLAYQDEAPLRAALEGMGMVLVANVEIPSTDTGFYIAHDTNGMAVWAWRGTRSRRNWLTDIDAPFAPHPRGGLVHRGIYGAWSSALPDFKEYEMRRRVLVLGHSLGGGLAKHTALWLTDGDSCESHLPIAVRTFGCPRIGNRAFTREYDRLVPDTIRVVHEEDVVPRLPPSWLGYRHTGGLMHLYDDGHERGICRSLWDWLRRAEHRAVADVDGEGIRDHFMQRYIDTIARNHLITELP